MSRLAIVALVLASLLCGCATTGSGGPGPATRIKGGKPAANLRASPPLSEEPRPDELMAGLVLFRYWRQESDKVKAHLDDISNRSQLFGDLAKHYRSLFEEMEQVQREGLDRLARGDREGAFARLNALWMALPVVLASHGEDGGMVTAHWLSMLADMNRRTAPLLEAALGSGFDRRAMEVAARRYQADLEELEQNLPKIQAALARGQLWTSRTLFVADGITLAIAAYNALGLLEGGVGGGGGPRLPVRFPVLAGAGAGGAAAGVVVLPVEMLESLRELVRLGAISAATLSTGLTLMAGKPQAVGGPGPPAPSGRPPAGVRGSAAPDPRIDGTHGLKHSFGQHAEQWFGRPVNMSTHLEHWKALLKRAASSSQVFDWTTSGEATTAHLARVEGKWFVVQFYKGGRRSGQLATAFVPNQAELGAMLRRLGH